MKKETQEKNLKNKVIHQLFDCRYKDQPVGHEFQLVISRNTQPMHNTDWQIGAALVDTLMQNTPGFDIEGFLDYQIEYSDNPHVFLRTFSDIFEVGLSLWNSSGIIPATSKGERIKKWQEDKKNYLKERDVPVNLPNAISHKILTLEELGIIGFLRTKYFPPTQTARDYNDEAKLIASILGIRDSKHVETVRKSISGITSTGKDDIMTQPAINAVKSFLATFNIDIETIKVKGGKG